MPFYRFHERNGHHVAITDDITGANLPKVDGDWKADGLTEIRVDGPKRLGVEPEFIIDTIEREGFYLGSIRNG